MQGYLAVSATFFGLVALAHFGRALAGLSIEVSGNAVPLWASWLVAVLAVVLAAWAVNLLRRRASPW